MYPIKVPQFFEIKNCIKMIISLEIQNNFSGIFTSYNPLKSPDGVVNEMRASNYNKMDYGGIIFININCKHI